ncbi:hypothetical protein HRI_000162400 [Hibiscus trionum]|uniref:Uncharacterized protein n=1 Tax=Hibiscus trionum TaxID=183268 RepID=A0A9W7GVP8_HIBTR|nr:hypothetical protein HRI_000162400 [Hibiscus trionum]
MVDVVDGLGDLSLEEDEVIVVAADPDPVESQISFDHYFVGSFLTSSFCPLRVLQDQSEASFQWDASLKAPVFRRNIQTSPWLREEDGGRSPQWWNSVNQGIENQPPPQNKESQPNLNPGSSGTVSKGKIGFPSTQSRGLPMGWASGPLSSSFDTTMDIGEEGQPITASDGLKRHRTLHAVSSHKDSNGSTTSVSAGLDKQVSREP